MITDNYIIMCEQAPKELWNGINHIGTLMAWRSFRGIIKPCKKRRKPEGLVAFIPETLVVRTWLKNDEDIMVTEINKNYPGLNGDKGTPVYSLEQLFEMACRFSKMNAVATLHCFWKFVSEGRCWWHSFEKSAFPDPSLLELLLAFVTHEKYNKIWTGEKWDKMKKEEKIS